ncbi:MAG: FAD-dependent oxidoreductase [Acidobacteriota bacterium]
MSASDADVIIIGAGIVGAALADRLSAERMHVTVLEASHVGGGATAAGMGHVVVMDDSEAQFALTSLSRRLWSEYAAKLPASGEYEARGTLWVASDDDELDAVRTKLNYYRERGMAAAALTAAELAQKEPNLRRGLTGALFVKDDSILYAPSVARFLLERAQSRGAIFMQSAAVAHATGTTVELASGTVLRARNVIHAAGTKTKHLPVEIPVVPRKGHLAITDRYPDFLRHQVVELGYLKSAHGHDEESVAFNVQPRATGQILIGSSRQYGVADPAVEPRILARMLQRAVEYMPGLSTLSVIRTWTGFRSATPDGLPLIGPVHSHPGLWLATGHEGLGITTSLGTAQILADQILEREPEIPVEPYLPKRFAQLHAHA